MAKVKKENTETTSVAVFNPETFKANQLPELIGKREIMQKIIDDNPFVEIIDTATYEQAKKHRTTLRTGRTSTANEKKMVLDRLKEVVIQAVSMEYDDLGQMPAPAESLQQAEIDRWDQIKKDEKEAKAKAEQDRIDAIKATIELFRTSWKKTIDSMLFDEIEATTAEFDKVVTEYDKAPLEEFSVIFNRNLSDLELALIDKTKSLNTAENLRLEQLAQKEAAEKLAKEKASFEKTQKEAADKLTKDKKEFEDKQKAIELENKKKQDAIDADKKAIADAQAKLDADKKSAEEVETKRLVDIEAARNKVNVVPDELKLRPKTPQDAIPPTPVTESVKEIEVIDAVSYDLPKEPTWNTVFESFKESGEKSLSKWLELNYNVPTKIQ